MFPLYSVAYATIHWTDMIVSDVLNKTQEKVPDHRTVRTLRMPIKKIVRIGG